MQFLPPYNTCWIFHRLKLEQFSGQKSTTADKHDFLITRKATSIFAIVCECRWYGMLCVLVSRIFYSAIHSTCNIVACPHDAFNNNNNNNIHFLYSFSCCSSHCFSISRQQTFCNKGENWKILFHSFNSPTKLHVPYTIHILHQ